MHLKVALLEWFHNQLIKEIPWLGSGEHSFLYSARDSGKDEDGSNGSAYAAPTTVHASLFASWQALEPHQSTRVKSIGKNCAMRC